MSVPCRDELTVAGESAFGSRENLLFQACLTSEPTSWKLAVNMNNSLRAF